VDPTVSAVSPYFETSMSQLTIAVPSTFKMVLLIYCLTQTMAAIKAIKYSFAAIQYSLELWCQFALIKNDWFATMQLKWAILMLNFIRFRWKPTFLSQGWFFVISSVFRHKWNSLEPISIHAIIDYERPRGTRWNAYSALAQCRVFADVHSADRWFSNEGE